MEEHVIDKRVIERQIRNGKLDPKAFEQTLGSLPDLADRVARGGESEASRMSASVPPPAAPVLAAAAVASTMDEVSDVEADEPDDESSDDPDASQVDAPASF